MKELITLKFALICSPLILILLIQIIFLIYVLKCKREINRLPEDSDREEEIRDKIFEDSRIYTNSALILLALALLILLVF